MQDYVEKRDGGGYYLTGSRVALDSVVLAFQRGAAPESILRSFPTIGSLAKVYGALTFYLENRSLVDEYLREQDRLAEEIVSTPLSPALAEKVRSARENAQSPA